MLLTFVTNWVFGCGFQKKTYILKIQKTMKRLLKNISKYQKKQFLPKVQTCSYYEI